MDTLEGVWPLKRPHLLFMKHFYYESDWSLSDFAPLLLLYSIVFLYITFSVGMYMYSLLLLSLSPSALSLTLSLSFFLSIGKIELVRSKLGLGFTAVITVISSLTMSLGICTFFGMSITISGR